MNVPTFPHEAMVDKDGMITKPWENLFIQLLQNMQQALSEEGIVTPSQTSSDMAIIQPNALNGTLLFDTSSVNGGSASSPNGRLYIRLADGVFHPITNT